MSEDIPIRPRYGAPEDVEETQSINSGESKLQNSLEAKHFNNTDKVNTLVDNNEINMEVFNPTNEMFHYVTENLEEKLRQKRQEENYISDNTVRSSSATTKVLKHLYHMEPILPIDPNILNDIEIEAQYLATSVDNLTENLCNLLHSISSITADNVEVHKIAVDKLTNSIDANIKCMYTIMAKTEEISKSMQPTERIGTRIREIKQFIDVLDNIV